MNSIFFCCFQSQILYHLMTLGTLPTSSSGRMQWNMIVAKQSSLVLPGCAKMILVASLCWRIPGLPSWKLGSTALALEKFHFTIMNCRALSSCLNWTWFMGFLPLMCKYILWHILFSCYFWQSKLKLLSYFLLCMPSKHYKFKWLFCPIHCPLVKKCQFQVLPTWTAEGIWKKEKFLVFPYSRELTFYKYPLTR